MNRAQWQRLAQERASDAEILLNGGQWAGAYYLAGYAVECGLKSCVLAFVENNPDIVFRDKKYSEKCWTHDIGNLVALADLPGRGRPDSAPYVRFSKYMTVRGCPPLFARDACGG